MSMPTPIEDPSPRLADARLRPVFRVFIVALGILVATLTATVWWSLHQPWLGIDTVPLQEPPGLRVVAVWPHGPAVGILAEGDVVTGFGPAGGEILPLRRQDLVEDPDLLPDFSALNSFLSRQDRWAAALAAPVVRMTTMDGREVKVQARQMRPLKALPVAFWAYQLYGAVALLVGAWLWSTAGSRLPAALLLGSGVSFLLLCATVSLITTRELALPATEFRTLLAIYHLGNNIFSLFLLALLWHYPARLGARYIYWLFALWVVYAWLNERFQWHDLPGHNVGFQVALFSVMGVVTIAAQWLRSRGRPADRAVVKFLLISIIFLNSLAIALYYHMAWGNEGEALLPLVIALGMVVCIYLALVVGVLRYRLFDLERWWVYLWLWLAAAVAILGMDALMSLFLPGLSRYSLLVALFFIGWIYFPLRQWLWEKVFPATAVAMLPEQLPQLILRLVVERRTDPEGSWCGVLKETFMPLELRVSQHGWREPRLLDSGERLFVPGIRDGGYELCLAQRGTRLFSPHDLELVRAMHAIIIRLDAQLERYRQDVARERERIMRDLHDDVGGRLLTLVHECEGRRVARISREALDALREVIYFSMDAEALMELPDVAGRWRSQLKARLEQQGVGLAWVWDDEAMADCAMPSMTLHNIGRILQEAVSNALKHARPATIRVHGRMADGTLYVTIANDGIRSRQGGVAAGGDGFGGRGLPNMRKRAEEVGGSLSIEVADGVYRVELSVPVPPAEPRCEALSPPP